MAADVPVVLETRKEGKELIFTLVVVLVLIAFTFSVGGYTFFAACGRGKEMNWLDEAAVKKTDFAPYYANIQHGHQWLQDHQAQEVYITNRDGLKLHAYWVPAKAPKGTAMLVHGYHSCALMDFSIAFERYHQRGMNLLLPSHRAHGKSEGKYITFGVRECGDLLEWIEYHNHQFGILPMMISGMSMGAATVMYLAGEELPQNVKSLNADCGFTSPKEIIAKVFRDASHLPAWPILWATDLFARFFAGFRLSEKVSTETLKRNACPILFVHGMKDTFVPCEMTRRSFEASGGEKALLLVQNATHGTSFLHDKEHYLEEIERLLRHCLKEET